MCLAFQPFGDSAVRVVCGADASAHTLRRIRAFCAVLAEAEIEGVLEWVPGFLTVTVFYLPQRFSYPALCERLREVQARSEDAPLPKSRRLTLPVSYGGVNGQDLDFLAQHARLTCAEVIALHTAPAYRVQLIGFTPGFPYLTGLHPRLVTPRLESPRAAVPAGSVGIAGAQTGVYPQETPGGWRLIGRTPVKLFDLRRTPPALVVAGDYVAFRAIEDNEYRRIETQCARGAYTPELVAHKEADE